MEKPHSLLMLVLNQHYRDRPDVIEDVNKTIREYSQFDNSNYERTLSKLYQLLNSLPADILLYFLTLIPLPVGRDEPSTLLNMMRQMHSSAFQQNMRPILVQYLNSQVPPLVPIHGEPTTSNRTDRHDDPSVYSIIDEKIKNSKNKPRRTTKPRPRGRSANVKPLAYLCAAKIHRNLDKYRKRYEKRKSAVWKLVRGELYAGDELARCYDVLRDLNKKIKWLHMFETGDVPLDVIRDEYGASEVFYQQKHFNNAVSEDLCDVSQELRDSLKRFIDKCNRNAL